MVAPVLEIMWAEVSHERRSNALQPMLKVDNGLDDRGAISQQQPFFPDHGRRFYNVENRIDSSVGRPLQMSGPEREPDAKTCHAASRKLAACRSLPPYYTHATP